MPKSRATDVTGDVGAHLVAVVLAPIATVEARGENIELDYYCELRTHAGCAFHVQAKGSEEPTYGKDFISSLSISRRTVEDNWLKQVYPVYVLMADVRTHRVFFVRVAKDNYEPGCSETCTFRIPLMQELTAENVGNLMPDILANQPKMTPEEATRTAAQFRQDNPLLCHDLSEIDAFLEIMRGSDQTAQMNAKVAIRTLVASSRLDSHRLEAGLIEIFRNCKDRITQSHELDTLVAIGATGAGPEIIKQIDRNTRTYEYMSLRQEVRHPNIDFLFQGLARLCPPRLVEEVKRLFDHPDPVVLRGALWLVGDLKLRGLNDRLMGFLNSQYPAIRDDAARVLAALNQKGTKIELLKILGKPTTPKQLAAAINALTQSRSFIAEQEVVGCLSHEASDVRTAAIGYLGATENALHFNRFVKALRDEEPEVRQKAAHSITRLSSVPHAEKEVTLLNALSDIFDAGETPQTAAVMSAVAELAGNASRATLVKIFHLADNKSLRHAYYDEHGSWRLTIPINLKTQALDILSRGNIDDLTDEIVDGITHSDEDSLGAYLRIVAEKRIIGAFEVIKSLPHGLIACCADQIVMTAYALKPDETVLWAIEQLLKSPDPQVFFGFCRSLHCLGVDLQTAPGFIDHVQHLFSILENRAWPNMYNLVRRYQVPGSSQVISDDLKLVMNGKSRELNMPVWDMYETIAVLPDTDGHEKLLQHIRICPAHHRLPILEYLSQYRPELARVELPNHIDDADLIVREGVEKLIDRLSVKTKDNLQSSALSSSS